MIRAACALMLLALIPAGGPAQPPDVDALVGGRVYVAPDRPPLEDATVIFRNGIITVVGTRGAVQLPPDARVLDCTGRTVLAAFWNSHVHFTEPKWSEASSPPPALQAALDAMLLQYGFASVFDTGSFPAVTRALKRRIEAGELKGPAILTTGMPFVPRDGTPVYVAPLVLPELTSPEGARTSVQARVGEGVDGIKLMTTSITSRHPFPSMPLGVVIAAADEAHRHGKVVLAHPTNHGGLVLALRGGADVIVHTTPDSGAWGSDLVAEMRRRNVALVPTLKLWDDVGRLQGLDEDERRRFQAVGIGQLRAFADAGGRVLFGTDVGFMTDYDPAAEYAAMSAAGLSFTRILESLTTAPARQFKQGDITGTIERGKRADIVIVQGDPATDIGALTRVTRLYRAGRTIYQANARGD